MPVAKETTDIEPVLDITPVKYDVTLAVIGELKERYKDLKIIPDDKESYEANRVALGVVRPLRTAVNPKRKQMNANAQAYIKKVNDEGKEIIRLLREVEDPLKADKDKEDDRLQAIEDEKIQAKQAQYDAVEAIREMARNISPLVVSSEIEKIIQALDCKEITLNYGEYYEDANRAKFQTMDALEVILSVRLEVEKADAERKAEDERLTKEREELEAKQKAVDTENERKLEEIKKAQGAKAKALDEREAEFVKKEAATKAETDRIAEDHKQQMEAREQAERERLQRVAEADEAARQEALKPDKEKLEGFMNGLIEYLVMNKPQIDDKESIIALARIVGKIEIIIAGFKSDIKNL